MAILPALVLIASILGITWFCQLLMEEAERADMELPTLLPLFLSVVGFALVACFFVITHAVRMSHRIAGPALRITTAMQRVRVGDIGFRVHLRRGDYLSEIAIEFNRVLEWLNENPPEGVRTGSDVVDVSAEDRFSGVELDPADLEEMHLSVAERDAVDLEAVDLEAVDLEAVDLEAVDLEAVDLEAVDLEAGDIEELDLEAEDFEEMEDLEMEDPEMEDPEMELPEVEDPEVVDLEIGDLEPADHEVADDDETVEQAGDASEEAGEKVL